MFPFSTWTCTVLPACHLQDSESCQRDNFGSALPLNNIYIQALLMLPEACTCMHETHTACDLTQAKETIPSPSPTRTRLVKAVPCHKQSCNCVSQCTCCAIGSRHCNLHKGRFLDPQSMLVFLGKLSLEHWITAKPCLGPPMQPTACQSQNTPA